MNRVRRCVSLFAAALVVVAGAAWADEPVVVKIATVAPDGSPWAIKLQDFKKSVETAVPGKVKIKIFVGGTLGDENETVLATKRGQIQGVGASTGALASQVPEFSVLELPYLFRSYEEVDAVTAKIRADIEKSCTDRGLVFSFWSENGFRGFGGKFKVSSPADLKGRKMRSQENPIHLAMYRDFGASPVPIPTTEALTSLQTGVVDGYDQSALYTFAASWHTASTHYTTSDHIYQGAAILFNKAAYDSWPEDVRKAVNAGAAAIEDDLKKQVRAMTPVLLDNLAQAGLTVTKMTPEQKQPFMAIAEKTRDGYLKTASAGEKALGAKINKALAEYRKGQK